MKPAVLAVHLAPQKSGRGCPLFAKRQVKLAEHVFE